MTVDESGVARLTGELDLACARARVGEQLVGGDIDIVDLSGVTYLDSDRRAHALRASRPPGFVAPPDSPPRRTLELSGLLEVMDVSEPPA